MQNEFEILSKKLFQLCDDTCDAFLAYCSAEGTNKILLKSIYERKDKERSKLAKEISILCQNM